MPASDIAVIIATYRRAHLIERALDSVARQTLRPREIIVVDDASGDETGAVVEAWAARHAMPVTFIAARVNGGAGVARNLGMAAATSPLIAFLDSDDAYAPEALATLAAPLAAYPNAVVSFADAVQLWDDGTPSRPMMRRCLTPGVDTTVLDGALHRLSDPTAALLLTTMIPTCAAVFRRSAAEAVGWMPTYRFGEDWIFWLRLAGQGDFLLQFVDLATVYRQGDNLTDSNHGASQAHQLLHSLLGLRDGGLGVVVPPSQRARLDRAIDDQLRHFRYHVSRRGIAHYWRATGSAEGRATGGRLRHLVADPKSLFRAALRGMG